MRQRFGAEVLFRATYQTHKEFFVTVPRWNEKVIFPIAKLIVPFTLRQKITSDLQAGHVYFIGIVNLNAEPTKWKDLDPHNFREAHVSTSIESIFS